MEDLFGLEIIKDVLLRDKFIEPPFSVLDTKAGTWQNRKRIWMEKGLKSEVGRDESITFAIPVKKYLKEKMDVEYYGADAQKLNTSIFNPALCELLYHWFCKQGGDILDPFAGGAVRGVVANYLGYKYTGIELRPEQVESNKEQALSILDKDNQPKYYIGDSNKVLDNISEKFDFVFSCPPYADLEVYSDLPDDLSNMDYKDFLDVYENIIRKSCNLLKSGCYAAWIVGEVRDKNGNFYGFVPDTINAFKKAGMLYYNEAVLLNPVASASMRADRQFTSGKKLVKIHQNVLIFKKIQCY